MQVYNDNKKYLRTAIPSDGKSLVEIETILMAKVA